MKAVKITGYALAALLVAACAYFWFCSAYSWLSGTPLSLFGYRVQLTGDAAVSESLPPRTLLFLQPLNDDAKTGDVVTFAIPNGNGTSFVGQVIDIPDAKNALIRYSASSPDIIVPLSMLGDHMIYRSDPLGKIAYFAASPVGMAVLVVLPILLLLLLRIAFLMRKKQAEVSSPLGLSLPSDDDALPKIEEAAAETPAPDIGEIAAQTGIAQPEPNNISPENNSAPQ